MKACFSIQALKGLVQGIGPKELQGPGSMQNMEMGLVKARESARASSEQGRLVNRVTICPPPGFSQ